MAFAGPFFGVSYFTAGVVLAIMVLPIVTAICREVFATAPADEKEAALALGMTRWEMLRLAVLPRSQSGITGAAILGLGRAIGETIAVTMVIGNSVLSITKSIFGQGATMPSVIANEFTEATEPYHLQSLFVVAAWLLVISLIVNIAGRFITRQAEEDWYDHRSCDARQRRSPGWPGAMRRDRVMTVVLAGAVAVTIAVLAWVLIYVAGQGLKYLGPGFFTTHPARRPVHSRRRVRQRHRRQPDHRRDRHR